MQKSVYEYISKQTNDPIVEWKICPVSKTEFAVFQSDLEFYNKISPVINGIKYQIPTPTLCPEERQRRRLIFRNERKLYKRKCDFSGKDIISIYSPESPYKVYDQKIWRSDKWNPIDYGIDFDFSKNFTEQFKLLQLDVPKIALMNDDGAGTSENCTYCQDFAYGKNNYLVTSSWHIENSYYCDCALSSKNLVDCSMMNNNSEYVYWGINCDNVKYSRYIQDSTNSHHCDFCHGISNCSYCFCCIGLQNKQNCIFNKQYSKEEYQKKVQYFFQQGYDYCVKLFEQYKKEIPLEYTILRNTTGCFGNNIINSKNIVLGFDVFDVENAKYCTRLNSQAKDCYDVHQSGSPILSYENLTSDISYHCSFITWCRDKCRYLYYCDNCHNCANCFGCNGLRDKSYCILNKQYNKEDYQKILTKIIVHMQETKERGEFFNPNLSPFGYNETVANEYFPLTREEAIVKQYKRQDNNYDQIITEGVNTVKGKQVESLKLDKDILTSIIICEISNRPFRIIKQELEFYRKHNIPLPRKHPDIRHLERMKLRPDRNLYFRTCDQCNIDILSVYPQDYELKVYCKTCYNKEIYG